MWWCRRGTELQQRACVYNRSVYRLTTRWLTSQSDHWVTMCDVDHFMLRDLRHQSIVVSLTCHQSLQLHLITLHVSLIPINSASTSKKNHSISRTAPRNKKSFSQLQCLKFLKMSEILSADIAVLLLFVVQCLFAVNVRVWLTH